MAGGMWKRVGNTMQMIYSDFGGLYTSEELIKRDARYKELFDDVENDVITVINDQSKATKESA